MAGADRESHTLAGPYAMDALSDAERLSFDAHLADCAQCRDDVREMREATARLAMATAVRPRPGLRAATIHAARLTSQLGPFAEKKTTTGSRVSAIRAASSLLRAAGRLRSARLSVRVGLAAATVLVVVATVLGVIAGGAMERLHQSQRQNDMIAAVLAAPDAVMMSAPVSTGGSASLVMSHRQGAAVFTAHGMLGLPSTESYEIWLMGPGGKRPAGMLRTQPGGMAGPALVLGMRPGDIIGISVEPAAGSALPTSALVVVFRPHRQAPARPGQ